MRMTCLRCGDGFEARRKSRKYCSHKCYVGDLKEDKESSGFNWRKGIMRTAAHEDSALSIMLRKLDHAGAPYREVYVLVDDFLRERDYSRSQVRERYEKLTRRRRATLRKVIRDVRKENHRVLERWENG